MAKPIPAIADDVASRFWAMVERRGPDDCWEWTGARTPKGRGQFKLDGEIHSAPRIALALVGMRPDCDTLLACHTCDNPGCMNPAHLWWGTDRDNVRDMMGKGRAKLASGWQRNTTHCKRGHEFTPENTMPNKGGRKCRKCDRILAAKYREKRRAARVAAKGEV